MADQVPAQTVGERYERLVELQERISLERNRETVGSFYEVLVEGESKKDHSRMTARTRTNKIVHVRDDTLKAGEFHDAVITGAHPHHLDGVLA